MTPQAELAIVRRAYARQIAFFALAEDARLVEALSAIRREDFLPPGPWRLSRFGGATGITPDADPLYLYQDGTVPILSDKGLNNGQPSFVTRLIGLCDVREGDRVIHIEVGTGYYTALLATLAGPSGRVTGIEIEPDLAAWARDRLAPFANTDVVEADGFTMPLGPADVILVNAGTPRFTDTWFDALVPGGRLIVPLASRYEDKDKRAMTRGVVVRLVRDDRGFAASLVIGVDIYPCAGAGDPAADAALSAAIAAGGAAGVTRLVRGHPPASCWLRGEGWALTSD